MKEGLTVIALGAVILVILLVVALWKGLMGSYELGRSHVKAETHVSCRPYLTSSGNVYLRVKQTDGTTLALYQCLGPDIPDTVSLEDYPLHEREQHPEKWREKN